MDETLGSRLRREAWLGRPFDWRYGYRRLGLTPMVNVAWEERRTLFLVSGKCGSTSVKKAVLKAQGKRGRRVHETAPRLRLWQVAASDFRKVAVVRNPYARAVSVWQDKVRNLERSILRDRGGFTGEESFLEFLRGVERMDDYADLHIRAQWKGMVWNGRFLPERVIKLEEPEAWEALRETLPGLGRLPVKNASGAEPWRALCEGEAGEIVRRRWALDFEVFGYER